VTETTTIDMIRHGEPVGGKRYRGQIDDPLSEKGWQQMRSAVAGKNPWDAIISSPLSRCAEFARELSDNLSLPVTLDDRFKEIGFGDWEGKTKAEIQQDDPDIVHRFWVNPVANRPNNAEKLIDFNTRIVAAFNDAVQSHRGKHVLIVGHAGIMRMTLCHVLRMPIDAMFRIDVPNAGITRIKIDHQAGEDLAKLVFHAGKL
jgi:alpha-ribazole phosphatase/probable phosphoglycerate mutase